MPRNYVCGVVRDQLKRFLVIQYHLTGGKKIASVSAESWVSAKESPIKALTTEFNECFGIASLDIFNIKHTKILTRISEAGTQNINVFIMDIREAVTFKLLDSAVEVLFLQWDHLLNAIKDEIVIPTTYSKCITDRLNVWKTIN